MSKLYVIAAFVLTVVLSVSLQMYEAPQPKPGPSILDRHQDEVSGQAERAAFKRDSLAYGIHMAEQIREQQKLLDQGATAVVVDSAGKIIGVFPQSDSP